ncbi:exopolysaccharide biosynthesis polyprenyl glycosylphosphotransferase [Methylocella silvestris BL2]|uniref:Exopolysaccharide biosynthesis polyprenyl glycosylphosphotransferase n=1 Tax=Methylocella silvestris (strain DSM 15510 / CIP 108128 / LMG 27833 / NCIMB 13906 / BL2) TaxID=395965 RepID=B8ETS4_METSB|nr:undecaprenyl-phosphate glucose phosphotransferase [Methylocella silvestris]ACK52426.1 exopolysaccharide biosynthesis polyprenyl glycosylphosphotransferase [Methylocella silvestris BL2]
MYFNRLSQIAESEIDGDVVAASSAKLYVSYKNIEVIAGCVDIFLITLSSVLGVLFYQYIWSGESAPIEISLGVGLSQALLYTYVASSRGLYRLPVLLAPSRYLGRIFMTWAVVVLFVAIFLVFLRGETVLPRGAMTAAAVMQISLLLVARWLAEKTSRSLMARGGLAGRRVVTLGEPSELLRLSTAVLFRYFGLTEVARVSLASGSGASAEDVLVDLDRALHEARESHADQFVVALRWNNAALLETVRERLRASPLPVELLPDYTIRSVLGRRLLSTSGPGLTLEIQRAPLTRVEQTIKRTLDIVCSSIGIVLLSPLFVMIAVLIKLDSKGPVIFKQRRNGFNARQFQIYKFRSMTVQEDGDKIVQARRNDRRVTRVGQFLRQSSMDELPQLFNVLKGDMSLVGPRPHALAHDNEYKVLIAKYAFRHHVKPGITGWAQCNGLRGETGQLEQMIERVKLDLWYVNHWSIALDINILLRTCFEVLRNRAY